MKTKLFILLTGLLLLGWSTTFAQDLKTVPAPVTVTLEKKVVTPGSAAQITGTSVPLGDNKTVKIAIATPEKDASGKLVTVSLSGVLSAQGTFNVSFDKTKTPGAYSVTATSPDGKSTAKAAFNVVSAMSIESSAKRMKSSMEKLAGKSGKMIQAVKTAIDAKGNFPDRPQMDQDLAKIEEAFSQFPDQMTDINEALNQLSGLIKQYPGLANVPELMQAAQELTEVCDKADEKIEQTDYLLSQIPKPSEMSICDRMDAAVEALDFAGKLLDFCKEGPVNTGKFLIELWSSTVISEMYDAVVPKAIQDPAQKFVYERTMGQIKTSITEGVNKLDEYWKTPSGLVMDASKWLIGAGFDHLCERFVGPIEGVFTVDATNGDKPFWGYMIFIKGRLTLRFETKHNTGKAPIPLTGVFEGTAINIDVYEDLFAGNQTNKNSVLYRTIVKPISAGDVISQAMYKIAGPIPSLLALPKSFKVPVNGVFAADGNTVVIEVASTAIKDFKGLTANVYYASLPQGAMIPIVQRFDIPMQNAQFILSRGLRSPATVKVKTEKLSNGKLMKTIEQTFKRTEDLDDVIVYWDVKIKACSPECP